MSKDKCNVCGSVFDSDEAIEHEGHWFCPVCGSEDVDDINEDPYEDDDGEGDMLIG